MKIFKTLFIIFGICTCFQTCSAIEMQTLSTAKTTLDYKNVKPTAFSVRLKQNNSYNSSKYDLPASASSNQNLLFNPAMGVMMNSMMNAGGMNYYSTNMLMQQEMEYTKNQIQNNKTNEAETDY